MKKLEGIAPEKASFVYMDAIRFVAAVLVVLNHVRSMVLVDYPVAIGAGPVAKAVYYLAGFGHQSVMVFFVLSGFWITGAVVRRDGQPHFWAGHMIDRVSRLGIVLVPVLVLGGALDLVGFRLVAPSFYSPANGVRQIADLATTLSWTSLGANLVFLQSLVAPPFGSNGPLWSLAYEFWYYIWFPALWMLWRRQPSLALATLALGLAFPRLAEGFLSWLCGTALYFICEAAKRRGWIGKRGLARPLLIAGGTALLLCLAYSRAHPLWQFGALTISAVFAISLFGLYLFVPPQLRLLNPIAAYGARSSFSLYSVHYPLVALAVALLSPSQRLQPGMGSLALMAGMIGLAIVVGFLFSRATERNTTWLRRLLRSALLPVSRA